jgi:hypothetical protein
MHSHHASAYVSIRQHTSAYVSIRQHTSAYVSTRQHMSCSALNCSTNTRIHVSTSTTQHTSAYFSIRQQTTAYASMRWRRARSLTSNTCRAFRVSIGTFLLVKQVLCTFCPAEPYSQYLYFCISEARKLSKLSTPISSHTHAAKLSSPAPAPAPSSLRLALSPPPMSVTPPPSPAPCCHEEKEKKCLLQIWKRVKEDCFVCGSLCCCLLTKKEEKKKTKMRNTAAKIE